MTILPSKMSSTLKSFWLIIDKNQLVNDSDVVIEGEVVSKEVQLDFQDLPATDYKIIVRKVYKGDPGDSVEVRTSGGEIVRTSDDGETEHIIYIPDEDMVTFNVGEKVVLFLTNDKGIRPDREDFGYFVVGQFQGKFYKQDYKIKNKKYDFSVENFEVELQEIDKKNKEKGLKQLHLPDGVVNNI